VHTRRLSVGDIEIVRRGLEAFRAGDVETVLALASPDVIVQASAASDGAVHKGHAGILEVIETLRRRWKEFRLDPLEFYDLGGRVLVLGTVATKGRDEPGFASLAGWVWTVRDGRIASVEAYLDTDEAMRAVGLKSLPS
jgi:ketosteroid isomerase-like protein